MGISVLILGESGSGKTTSLRNFQPGEVAIINVAKKPHIILSYLFNTISVCINSVYYKLDILIVISN